MSVTGAWGTFARERPYLQRHSEMCRRAFVIGPGPFLTHSQAWTKHSGQPAYRNEAKLHLPAKTVEEIEQHEEWHRELSYLQDRKRQVGPWSKRGTQSVFLILDLALKQAILHWKARKTQERQIWIQTQQEAEIREKEPKSQAHQHRWGSHIGCHGDFSCVFMSAWWGGCRYTRMWPIVHGTWSP